jgi:hypothetical protein
MASDRVMACRAKGVTPSEWRLSKASGRGLVARRGRAGRVDWALPWWWVSAVRAPRFWSRLPWCSRSPCRDRGGGLVSCRAPQVDVRCGAQRRWERVMARGRCGHSRSSKVMDGVGLGVAEVGLLSHEDESRVVVSSGRDGPRSCRDEQGDPPSPNSRLERTSQARRSALIIGRSATALRGVIGMRADEALATRVLDEVLGGRLATGVGRREITGVLRR